MCLNYSLKMSSAAQGEEILPTHPPECWVWKPQVTPCAAGSSALVFHGHLQPGLGTSAGWVTGCPHYTQGSVLGLSHHLQPGLVPPVQQL